MFVFDVELAAPCNAKCDFCPQSFKPTGVNRDIKYLDKDLIVKIMNEIKEISKTEREKVIVDFCGMGENLLRKDLLLKSLEILFDNDRPDLLDVRLTTNGFYLTEDITSNSLFQRLSQIEISTAHTINKKKYELIYNINYDIVKENIMTLRDNFPGKIIMATVRVKQLRDEMKEYQEFWKPYVDDFLIHDFHTRGNSYPHPNPERKDLWRFDICGIFKHFVYISSDGNVLPCCNDVQSKYPLGDLREKSILEIVEKKKKMQLENIGFDICVGCDGGELLIRESKIKDEFDMPSLDRV